MKFLRSILTVLLLVALSGPVFAQTDTQKSDAEKSFDKLKTLAGGWEGPVTVVPAQPDMSMDKPMHVSLRVTSRGNALVHEMQEAGTPEDPARYDHPVTMFYVDSDRLLLTHYCDAGNRPRMVAKTSPDGKTLEFDFLDLAGSNHYGHMYHAVFTIIDANHHLEDWTFLMPGDKTLHAHFDLQRAK
jgi:phage tail protein X